MSKISIGTFEYNYKLRVSKKARYIRIQISSENGIELIVPKGVSLSRAEKYLIHKQSWIINNIRKIIKKKEEFVYLGDKVDLEFQYDLFIKKPKIELIRKKLMFRLPEGNVISEQQIFDEWLKERAKDYIPERTKTLAGKNGFYFNKITVRGQKSRWGSCSKEGNLSFNFKIMSYEKKVIDYIILHELCHLIEMNHSEKFWNLVEYYMPDYKKYKNILKGIS